MDCTEILKRGFEYDRWANLRWIDRLGGFKEMDRPFAIFEHILSANRVWLDRCGIELHLEKADLPLAQLFDQTARAWIDLISEADPDELISYQNSRGEGFTEPLGDIALHVINHGTYHRGQLRGLAQCEGFEGFPETDLILYLREQGAS